MTEEILGFLESFWLVLAVACFCWIVWRAFRPSNKRKMEDYGAIPLRERD